MMMAPDRACDFFLVLFIVDPSADLSAVIGEIPDVVSRPKQPSLCFISFRA